MKALYNKYLWVLFVLILGLGGMLAIRQCNPSIETSAAVPLVAKGQQKGTPQLQDAPKPQPISTEDTRSAAQENIENRMTLASQLEGENQTKLITLWRQQVYRKETTTYANLVQRELALRLRKRNKEATAILAALKPQLGPDNNDYANWATIQILGQAATKESIELLLQSLETINTPAQRVWIQDQLVQATSPANFGTYRDDLTEAVISSWEKLSASDDAMDAVAKAMAAIGNSTIVDEFFSTIAASGQVGNIDDFMNRADDKSLAAFLAIKELSNPAAISSLEKELTRADPDTDVRALVAGFGLAALQQTASTEILLNWIRSAPMDHRPIIKQWLAVLNDGDAVTLLGQVLINGKFANASNRQATIEVYNRWVLVRSEGLRHGLTPIDK
jgi:hypothetical protein